MTSSAVTPKAGELLGVLVVGVLVVGAQRTWETAARDPPDEP